MTQATIEVKICFAKLHIVSETKIKETYDDHHSVVEFKGIPDSLKNV